MQEASASGSYDKTENEDMLSIRGAVADIGVQAHFAVPYRSVHIRSNTTSKRQR